MLWKLNPPHWRFFLAAASMTIACSTAFAEETRVVQAKAESPIIQTASEKKPKVILQPGIAVNPIDPQANLKSLSADNNVWLDAKNKQVVLDGEVCLTRGMLEMFACPKGTKEHESIVSVGTKAYVVHAALLALGTKSGTPVKYYPAYAPATGTAVDLMIFWNDEQGKLCQARAQDLIRNIKTKQPMTQPWVFAGSGFYVDENTKKRYYLAEQGDFICVANFPTAMLDLPINSPQENNELLFEAFTERIPPRGTKVKLVLIPKLDTEAAENQPTQERTARNSSGPK